MFHEPKSDMPLFQWVLALNYREKTYVMYKNLKTQAYAYACLENRNYHVYRKLFLKNNFFYKMDPRARKLQEPRNKNKLEKIKITQPII